MGEITNEMVEKSFDVGREFYENRLNLKDGIKVLTDLGMNENSAVDYIYNFSNLIQGKLYTRTTNIYATELYIQRIFEYYGIDGLQNALLSLSQHIDYYEDKSGNSVKQKTEIYGRYIKLINPNFSQTVYPDQVDNNQNYSEGKTKKVLVNSYERNPIARTKCIEHFGLNCQVCNFNFEKVFGELGKDFIHVHHIVDISTIGNEYSVNPITDLAPVCPNCHAMLHKKKPAYSIEELRQQIRIK